MTVRATSASLVTVAGCAAVMLATSACGPIVTVPATASPTPTGTPLEGIVDVGLASPQAGWVIAVPTGMAVTHDGGSHWTLAVDSGGARIAAASAYFQSSTDGWLLKLGPFTRSGRQVTVMTTSDGGFGWKPQTPSTLPPQQDFWTGSVLFSDRLHGWVELVAISSPNFSWAYLFRTTDGGQTWAEVSAPFAGRMHFIDALTGWIVGGLSGGQLAVTHDGGLTWAAERVGTPFGPPIDGLSTLKVIDSGAVFAKSIWNPQTGTLDVDFFAAQAPDLRWIGIRHLSRESRGGAQIALVDARQWIIASDRGISVTRDAGNSLADIGRPIGGSIDFATLDVGLAAMSWGSCASFKSDCSVHAVLLRTQDGGRTWIPVYLPS